MSASTGEWGPVFDLPNVAVHAAVLPNGKVLMWGRRDNPTDSLDVHECTPFLWDPKTRAIERTPQPKLADGKRVNLFCAGHTFLPDGRLLVVGGHFADGQGLDQASIYDPVTNAWTPSARMNAGRWYPTATSLPDGSVLVLGGSFRAANGITVQNDVLQVWNNGAWSPVINAVGAPLNFHGLPLYPCMHVASDGRVFMSGALGQTYLLKTSRPGQWTPLPPPGGKRINGFRDYCPSIMYDLDKVIYIGGGNDGDGTHKPTAAVEIIDLRENPPVWRATGSMTFRRRQHNGTLLPDGTVLVTGGTRGGEGPNEGFNDLQPGAPVHAAELWNPATGTWTELAAESIDRCYHATAILLPDATVLSAGGGEYRPDNINPNNSADSHRNAQVFSPPYLFKGEPPDVTAAPASVIYGAKFDVGTSRPDDIGKVSLLRLPAVTHCFDQNQRILFLKFQVGAGKLSVTAPGSGNICPPGHYMMFLVGTNGVPSAAKIVRVEPAAVEALALRGPEVAIPAPVQTFARQAEVVTTARGTAVIVGITGTCPYGIGACWGGAYEALSRLDGVELVAPIPNASDSTAEVFLADESLPPLNLWDLQFPAIVNATYQLRGVEVSLQGMLQRRDGTLFLAATGIRPPVRLGRIAAAEKVQWNHRERARKPLESDESEAYDRLVGIAGAAVPGVQRVTVTGPLKQTEAGYELLVRAFHA